MKWCLAPPKQSGEIPDIDPVADEIAQGTDLISKDSHTTRDPESKRIQTPQCRLPVMKPRSISLQPAWPVRGALVRRSWCTAASSLHPSTRSALPFGSRVVLAPKDRPASPPPQLLRTGLLGRFLNGFPINAAWPHHLAAKERCARTTMLPLRHRLEY